MPHTADAIAACLLDAHGVTATVEDRTEDLEGVDNQLFHALVDPASSASTGWPSAVAVRVGWNEGSIATAERLHRLMSWCAAQRYPAVPILGRGTLAGTGYTVMPFVDAKPSVHVLRKPWRLRDLTEQVARLLLDLHRTDPDGWPCSSLDADGALADAVQAGSSTAVTKPMLDWLVANRHKADASGPAVPCHLDLHPMNVLWTWGEQPLVIDWDTAAMAPAVADLAFMMELTSLGGAVVPKRLNRTITLAVGRLIASGTYHRYRATRAVDEEALRWWRVLLIAQATLWARSITVMGTAPRPDASAALPPQFDAVATKRFQLVTRGAPA